MKDTAFEQQKVFDAHIHLFSYSFAANVGELAGWTEYPADRACEKLGWDVPSQDPLDLARRWVQELDAHGIDRAVILHTLPGNASSVEVALKEFGNRFVGYVMVNPNSHPSVETMFQAVDEWGFRGVTLFPSLHHFRMQDDSAREVLQFANERKLIVFVHCGVLKIGFRKTLGLPCDFDIERANPLSLVRRAAEFPDIRFVIPHLGSGLLRELLMLADLSPHVYTDTSGIGGWSRYLPGAEDPADALKKVLDVMGPERVLFGSDSSFFPRGWREDVFEQQMAAFIQAGLGSEIVERILYDNMAALLGET